LSQRGKTERGGGGVREDRTGGKAGYYFFITERGRGYIYNNTPCKELSKWGLTPYPYPYPREGEDTLQREKRERLSTVRVARLEWGCGKIAHA